MSPPWAVAVAATDWCLAVPSVPTRRKFAPFHRLFLTGSSPMPLRVVSGISYVISPSSLPPPAPLKFFLLCQQPPVATINCAVPAGSASVRVPFCRRFVGACRPKL
jgi:hypothetical protein